MSDKKIKNKLRPLPTNKRPTNKAPQPPAPPAPLNPEQKHWMAVYQELLPKLIEKVGSAVGNPGMSFAEKGQVLDTTMADVDHYTMMKYKGAVNLRDLTIIYGGLAGQQAGAALVSGRPMPASHYHEAGLLFEAAMKATAQAVAQAVQKAKLAHAQVKKH